ncbi:response regulator [Paenibacillus taichungensis]|uniref:Response regulator n=1 Tax=Paenibacillus taichungensis TaxID=484184 RepID=A0ABX2MLL0_9BACL|nr:response regulator [Paenibacillus taichungensis]NUU54905.1 response regulator [Paenibacillus taichungensis]
MTAKIRVLIAEDIEQQSNILIQHLKGIENVEVVDVVRDSQGLLSRSVELQGEIDALILDVELGEGGSGLDTYIRLPYRGVELPAILVTGANPEAPVTYDVGVIDVVSKPYTFDRMVKAITKLEQHLNYNQYIQDGGVMVPVYDTKSIIQLPLSEVIYIQADKGNKRNFVKTKDSEYISIITLKVYDPFLLPHNFYRLNRHTIINLKSVKDINKEHITFKGSDIKLDVQEEETFKDLLAAWTHAQTG